MSSLYDFALSFATYLICIGVGLGLGFAMAHVRYNACMNHLNELSIKLGKEKDYSNALFVNLKAINFVMNDIQDRTAAGQPNGMSTGEFLSIKTMSDV